MIRQIPLLKYQIPHPKYKVLNSGLDVHLVQVGLKVHGQANTKYLFQNTKYTIMDWILLVEANLEVDDQADGVDEWASVQDCCQ